VADYLIISFQY